MTVESCFYGVCFVAIDGGGQKFFGFSEYLAGLALMVLAWTNADVRYRFRVLSAPIPLLSITFWVLALIGVLALLTDLWRAEQWLVPKGRILTPASWQAVMGGSFLLTFLTWTWFAFIRPPRYGRHNAKPFAQTLYRFILKGSQAELAVIADELAHSAWPLVDHATDMGRHKNDQKEREGKEHDVAKVERYANELLLLIANKRLCREIVSSAPGTALALFQAIGDTKKHGILVGTFARNIVNEAIANKDSFLYHETEGYDSGLLGYLKPLSQAMFADHNMVETIGTLLDPDIDFKRQWDAEQWRAYCRIVLMTYRSYINEGDESHSFVLFRAKSNLEHAVSDLYKLNGSTDSAWNDDLHGRVRAVVEFVRDAVEILETKGVPEYVRLRIRDEHHSVQRTFYDHIAQLIFELVFAASTVRSPASVCWSVQHNMVWSSLFEFDQLKGNAGAVVKFKVRRLMYNELVRMKRLPNYKGARILAFCLNVLGLVIKPGNIDRDSRALHKAVLTWVKRNYVWLHGYNSDIAESCLTEGMSYDAANRRLVRLYPANGLRRESSHIYLELDHSPSEKKSEAIDMPEE